MLQALKARSLFLIEEIMAVGMKKDNRYAFLVGIAIGLIVNLGLVPWLVQSPRSTTGWSIGLSPLPTARAESITDLNDPNAAMEYVFNTLLGQAYMPGDSALIGFTTTSTYFYATSQSTLQAGTIDESTPVRLDIAYVDLQDVSGLLPAMPPTGYAELDNLDVSMIIVAGTLQSGTNTAYVSGFVTTFTTQSGQAGQALMVTGVYTSEEKAVQAGQQMATGSAAAHGGQQLPGQQVAQSDFERRTQPNPKPVVQHPALQSRHCFLLTGCIDRCNCEYNACALLAWEEYEDQIKKIGMYKGLCMATAIFALNLGMLTMLPLFALLAVLAAIAFCVAYRILEEWAANRQLDRQIDACQQAYTGCLFERCRNGEITFI